MSILEYLSPKLAENPGGYNRRDYTGNPLTPDEIYEAFTRWISSRGMTLYPAQDEAVLEIAAGITWCWLPPPVLVNLQWRWRRILPV